MAILDILEYPDPRLRTRAKPVNEVDDSVRVLIVTDTGFVGNKICLIITHHAMP